MGFAALIEHHILQLYNTLVFERLQDFYLPLDLALADYLSQRVLGFRILRTERACFYSFLPCQTAL